MTDTPFFTKARLWRGACVVLLCMVALVLYSQEWGKEAHAEPARVNGKKLAMVTGPETGTYAAFGRDIAAQAKVRGHKVSLQGSNGSIDNIRRIVESKGKIGMGIVQSDILGFLQRSNSSNTKKIAARLSLVFPLYEEEVHILARKDILGLRDLKGKRVVVGKQGSGNMLTAINIMSLAEIAPGKKMYMDPAEGAAAVMTGRADAMIFVGGKPVPLFENMATLRKSGSKKAQMLDQVHFVPIDDQRVFKEYSPTRISSNDYAFVNETVLTAKVHAVLVAFNDVSSGNSYSNKRQCEGLYEVAETIYQSLDNLRVKGHLKWKETNLFEDVNQWQRNSCIWDGRKLLLAGGNNAPDNVPNALTNDLLDVLRGGN